MKLLFLLIVGIVLYFISRGYKTEKFENIRMDIKENFKGDLLNHEAGLLVALMAKVAKADGQVCELEAEMLKHSFSDISRHFENSVEIREKLKNIYSEEMKSFDNTIEITTKLYQLTKNDYTKRLKLMEFLLNLAFIDKEFSDAEFMICEDISNALKLKRMDFDRLITSFKNFYASQASNAKTSIEDAYKILEVNKEDDDKTIKNAYRKLVKQYHPDIVTGQGASQNIIDDATAKLQEINEAYEIIKKSRNI